MVLTYVYFGTNDLARAKSFYDAVLGAIGMPRCVTGEPKWDRTAAGWGIYGDGGMHELGFWVGIPFDGKRATTGNGSMVAFRAQSWQQVDEFHAAALAHVGRDDGAPGRRLNYASDFYAATCAILMETRSRLFAVDLGNASWSFQEACCRSSKTLNNGRRL